MATITGLTAAATQALIENKIVNATINGSGHLIFTRHDGSTFDAGLISDAVPSASITTEGMVELATNAETLAGTDAVRAVTPASLASLPGTRVEILTGIAESAAPTSYPVGVSILNLTTGSTWSLNAGVGTVVTDNVSVDRCVQTFHSNPGGTGNPRSWTRMHHSTNNGGGWTAWRQLMMMTELTPGSYTQSTTFTSYPQGNSRLLYTTANSGSWDFSGKAGEVQTYSDASDFARQTYTQHVGGSSAIPEVWTRTANSSSGWSKWLLIAEDTGWQPLTMTGGAGFTLRRNLGYRRKNGIVYLKGAISPPSGGYTPFATLPVGFRPAEDKIMAVTTNNTTSLSCVINSTGVINSWASATPTTWFSIEGMSFPND